MQTQLIFSSTFSWLYMNGQASFTLQAVSIIYCAIEDKFFFISVFRAATPDFQKKGGDKEVIEGQQWGQVGRTHTPKCLKEVNANYDFKKTKQKKNNQKQPVRFIASLRRGREPRIGLTLGLCQSLNVTWECGRKSFAGSHMRRASAPCKGGNSSEKRDLTEEAQS